MTNEARHQAADAALPPRTRFSPQVRRAGDLPPLTHAELPLRAQFSTRVVRASDCTPLPDAEVAAISGDRQAAAEPSVDDDTEPCDECGRPTYWDYDLDRRRHAVDPERGCFLIAGEPSSCDEPATVQFVYAERSGLNALSRPHCDAHSEASQPAETVIVIEVHGRHACAGEVSYP